MKIILSMVSTVNGKITKGSDPDITHWTSIEDKNHFFTLKEQHTLIVMGSHTYKQNRDRIQLSPKTLRIVLTKRVNAFKKNTVAGQLEFSEENPKQLISRLETAGYHTMLLVGGAEINSSFFKKKLIDELNITIEPILFGTGKNMLRDIPSEINLKLIKVQNLNTRGTLLLTYKVAK
jgi:dihydrofolate reductase